MRDSILLRLLVAALISVSGWLGTDYWYKRGQARGPVENPEPLARLVIANNEVMRRPAQSFVWKSANRGEELYAGEAVRTTTNSDAQIIFEKKQVTLSLDPDTVIEIAHEGGRLNLSFLKGNLFIKAGESADVTLQSGERRIALGAGSKEHGVAELAVSKPTTTAPLEVQSASGAVKDLSPKGATQPVRMSKFRILKPLAGEVSYIKPEDGELEIKFTPLTDDYDVEVLAGESRDELARLASVPAVSLTSGSFSVPFKVGKSFFQLVAVHRSNPEERLKTPISRLQVRAKIAPELIAPVDKSALTPTSERGDVLFQWSNPGQLDHLRFEISASPTMTPSLEARELDQELSHVFIAGTEPRVLYWRVIGRLPTTGEALVSPVRSFEVLSDKPLPLAAPRLQTPQDQTSVQLAEMREKGLKFNWTNVRGANSYEITVQEVLGAESVEAPRTYTFTSPAAAGHIEKLKSGRYTWSVIAKDKDGKASPPSEPRGFSVEGLPAISWSDQKTAETLIYKTEKPRLKAAWERGPGEPTSWRVRITPERAPAAETPWTNTTSPQIEKTLESGGVYIAEAESLDKDGNVLARTEPRRVTLELAPPPPAPLFSEELAKQLIASERGAVDISWQPISDVKEYQLELRSKDGAVVKSERVKATKRSFDRLKPGEYDVVLQAVDHLGRLSPESESRSLSVPEYSDVRAPKFKTLNVK